MSSLCAGLHRESPRAGSARTLLPIAAGYIASTDSALEQSAQFLQHEVAGTVPEGIIDALEVIKIDHDDGKRVAVAFGPQQFPGQQLLQEAPVKQSGQWVGDDLFLKILQCLLEFRVPVLKRLVISSNAAATWLSSSPS